MRAPALTLALCVLGAWCAPEPSAPFAPSAPSAPSAPQPSDATTGDRWQQLLAEYARGPSWAAWPPPATRLQLSLHSDNARPPLVFVPVPVPYPLPAPAPAPASAPQPAQCALGAPQTAASPPSTTYGVYEPYLPPAGDGHLPRPSPDIYSPVVPEVATVTTAEVSYEDPHVTYPTTAPIPTSHQQPIHTSPEQRVTRHAPRIPPTADSQLLLQQFRVQTKSDASLPPILIEAASGASSDGDTLDVLEEPSAQSEPAQEPAREPDAARSSPAAPVRRRLKCKPRGAAEAGTDGTPPPPRFERSLYVRGRLSVPRAGYTEPYAVWWDVANGASRVDLHGGTTSIYRIMKPDGLLQSILIQEDRTGESDLRRCTVMEPRRAPLVERALPVLPPVLKDFQFAGLVQVRGRDDRVERWRLVAAGGAGQLGGVRGEALTFHHELLVARSADNFTSTPIRYSVRVDSSVLGPDSDVYVHHYDEVRFEHHSPAIFNLDIADACEQVEVTSSVEKIELLREYTMLQRDARYDAELARFKRTFERRYADDVEEAVRKNLLIQNMRFTASGNRQGASFRLGTNFLSDRLDVEKRMFLGAESMPVENSTEPFPMSRSDVVAMKGKLPRHFDWRERGGVTPVRYQSDNCSSCWAFATVAAVEGVLFARTGRLVPLSEQTLVDCGHPYGTNGCGRTWPSFAYSYIKAKGLPARAEYTPYQAQVLTCRAASVPPITRITSHLNITANSVLALKVAIKKFGPTVVLIDAESSLQHYTGKFHYDAKCRKNSPNHAVVAVGWTMHRGKTYFILKNSWSASWGVDGYVYMRADSCGVLQQPSVPHLTPPDVLRVPNSARVGA